MTNVHGWRMTLDAGAWTAIEDRGMEVVAAPAEGAEEGRRGGGGGVTDEVRTRDDDGAWMSVEDGGIEVVAAPAEVGAEECGRGGGGVTDGVRKRDDGWAGMGDKKPAGDPKLCKTSFSCATSN